MDSGVKMTFMSLFAIYIIYNYCINSPVQLERRIQGPNRPIGRGMAGKEINSGDGGGGGGGGGGGDGGFFKSVESELNNPDLAIFGNVNEVARLNRKDIIYKDQYNEPQGIDPYEQPQMDSQFGFQNPVYELGTFKARDNMTDKFKLVSRLQNSENISDDKMELPVKEYKKSTPDYYTVDDNKKFSPRHSEIIPYSYEDTLYQLF